MSTLATWLASSWAVVLLAVTSVVLIWTARRNRRLIRENQRWADVAASYQTALVDIGAEANAYRRALAKPLRDPVTGRFTGKRGVGG